MRTFLELLRIIIIFALLGGFGWAILGNIYTTNEITQTYSWLGAVAILLLLFVLYRNKLQFSGWYKGKGKLKLPNSVTLALILSSILLIILPFILGSLLG
ncbi:hypothetical protein GH741_02170 [Aquibacillus halophilus]|uniref:Uncharacterized protein n=1 Tax=Aquibacillus halophilus TaxID=930132 RepID=A0A6A8DF40_9BACI|nr:hypothetical protein [Aquibacillus halophilus]MRH41477.1 hypothetical protein [Aquibacillus halophilus]